MQSSNSNNQPKSPHPLTALLLLSIILGAAEYFFPRIPLLPWLKPGLANCVTVLIVIRFGFIKTIVFSVMRIWVLAFYFGFSFIPASLAVSGTIPAVFAMAVISFLMKRNIGLVGISVTGALFHNLGQLIAAFFLFGGNPVLFNQIPLMILFSILFGGFNGVFAYFLNRIILPEEEFSNAALLDSRCSVINSDTEISGPLKIAAFALLLFCIGLTFIENLYILSLCALFFTVFSIYIRKSLFSTLLFPLRRFYLLFIAIGIFGGFFTYGKYLYPGIPITEEGILFTGIQWVKIYTWLQISILFKQVKLDRVIPPVFSHLFPSAGPMVTAGIEAARFFPDALGLVSSKGFKLFSGILSRPEKTLQNLFKQIMLLGNEPR